MIKNILKILFSIILMSSYWWSFKIIESFPDKEMQILTTLLFFILSIIASIIGAVLFIRTLVKIFKLKDKKIL